MVLQSIVKNDFGRAQTINTNMLKHLAYVDKINKDEVETKVIKQYKNGAWIEEHTTSIIITVNKSKVKRKKKLYYEEYQVTQKYKYKEDKTKPIGNRFFINVLQATKPQYKLIDSLAIA